MFTRFFADLPTDNAIFIPVSLLELLRLQYYLSDLVLNGFKHGPNIISILHSRSEPGPKY